MGTNYFGSLEVNNLEITKQPISPEQFIKLFRHCLRLEILLAPVYLILCGEKLSLRFGKNRNSDKNRSFEPKSKFWKKLLSKSFWMKSLQGISLSS